MLDRLPHLALVLALGACGDAALPPAAAPHQREEDAGTKPLRIGQTFTNGNCAIDSNHKLTGLCVASNGHGKCIAHEPEPSSKHCPVGEVVSETRIAACAREQSGEIVSRQHECSFLQDP